MSTDFGVATDFGTATDSGEATDFGVTTGAARGVGRQLALRVDE